jgi:drug/metabolite transporter (DMT)-like permease
MIGVALALLSAMSFGLSQILVRKNLDKSNFIYVSLTVTIVGNIILWPLALTFTNLNTVNPEGLLLFVLAGLLAPAIARLFYFKGMETAGISANASIFATYPLYTTIAAILLLGEALTTENWIGLVSIIVGVISVGRIINRGETSHKTTSRRGLISPMVGSLALAFSQLVRKEALNIHNQPLLGVAVGYTATLIVYLVVIVFSKNTRTSRFSRQDIKMFWKPGVGIAMGWLLSFFALSQEMVSIVAPILQTELLFILLFTYIFLRKIEKISPKLVASAILIVAGVMLISVN